MSVCIFTTATRRTQPTVSGTTPGQVVLGMSRRKPASDQCSSMSLLRFLPGAPTLASLTDRLRNKINSFTSKLVLVRVVYPGHRKQTGTDTLENYFSLRGWPSSDIATTIPMHLCPAWWCTPLISSVRRLRQAEGPLSLRPAWSTE